MFRSIEKYRKRKYHEKMIRKIEEEWLDDASSGLLEAVDMKNYTDMIDHHKKQIELISR